MVVACAIAMTCVTSGVAACADDYESDVKSGDFNITVSEIDENGQREIVTYGIEDLACDIYDQNNNLIYSGPMVETPMTRGYTIGTAVIHSQNTMYWYPKDNDKGFICGDGIAVDVIVETDKVASKAYGLTSGDSSTTRGARIEDRLYTGTSGYWKFYVKNNSSETINVSSGSITWG